MYSVYYIKNTYNGRVYVGSTKNAIAREKNHFYRLKNGTHKNRRLTKDYTRYGRDAFVFKILCNTNAEETALRFEQVFMDGFENTYNILKYAGKASGRTYTKTTLDNMSKAAKGRKLSPEHMRKMAESKRGTKLSMKTREKMSVAHRTRYLNGEGNHYSKLNAKSVYDILRRLDQGENRHDLSVEYNISYSNIGHIAQGSTWKKVSDKYKKDKAEAV